MPSIALCADAACPSKLTCYRFTAKPSPYQAYSEFKHDDDKCSFYIEAVSKSQVRRLDIQTEKK